MQDNYHLIARQFSAVLREWLTPAEFTEMVEKTKNHPEGICYSHDYCDANMAMDEAFTTITGREYTCYNDEEPASEKQNEIDTNTFNTSWDIAVENLFFYNEEPLVLTPQQQANKEWYSTLPQNQLPNNNKVYMKPYIPNIDKLPWHLHHNVLPQLTDHTVDNIIADLERINSGEIDLNDTIGNSDCTYGEMLEDLKIPFDMVDEQGNIIDY